MNYILIDKKPVVCTDLNQWAAWMEHSQQERIVAQTEIGTDVVSTVFLGIDHSFGGNDPVLYETMIFKEDGSEETSRYSTYEEALEGHLKACKSLDPNFKKLDFPEIDLVKIYEEEKEKHQNLIKQILNRK